jgi:hypothetical protein
MGWLTMVVRVRVGYFLNAVGKKSGKAYAKVDEMRKSFITGGGANAGKYFLQLFS